jgi:hypothetical protein
VNFHLQGTLGEKIMDRLAAAFQATIVVNYDEAAV